MSKKKLFKIILAYVLGLAILIYTGTGAVKWYELQEEEVYSLKIVDKWASSTYSKSSFSNHLYLKGCLVSEPENCTRINVRQDTYESIDVGDTTAFKFRKEEFYSGIHDMLGFVLGFTLLVVGGLALVVYFIAWLFDYE